MSLRIHHLNCGTMCPHGGKLIGTPGAGWLSPGRMVCHCLLVESNDGLVLVDTGIGMADVANPVAQLGRGFMALRPQLDPAETAITQVRALGFKPEDVRHLVVTHLDLDHAGGLPDFPHAKVHVHAREHAAAMNPSLRERARYRKPQIAHGPDWVLHQESGERWHGFDAVRALPGSGDDILLVPLHGHSRGHCAVAVRDGTSGSQGSVGDGWLLHCGDAYFHRGEIEQPPHCPPGLAFFQNVVQIDGAARHANQRRLRDLAHREAGHVQLFSAHDPVELERFIR